MKSDAIERDAVLEAVIRIAREAGALVMQVYATDFAVRGKEDASPVTQADECAEALIVPARAAAKPGLPWRAYSIRDKALAPSAGAVFTSWPNTPALPRPKARVRASAERRAR